MTVKDFLSNITDISWRSINLFIQDGGKSYFKLMVIGEEDFKSGNIKQSFLEQEIVNIGFETNEEEEKEDIIVYTKQGQEVE